MDITDEVERGHIQPENTSNDFAGLSVGEIIMGPIQDADSRRIAEEAARTGPGRIPEGGICKLGDQTPPHDNEVL